jgi:hypothetical protein
VIIAVLCVEHNDVDRFKHMASCSDGACTTLLIHIYDHSSSTSFMGKTATTHANTFGAISRLPEKDGQ